MLGFLLFLGFLLACLSRVMFQLGYRSGRRRQAQQGISTSLLDYPEQWSMEQRQALWYVHNLTEQAWRRGRGYAQAHKSNNFFLDKPQVVQLAKHAVRQASSLNLPPGWSPKRAQECWQEIFIQAYMSPK